MHLATDVVNARRAVHIPPNYVVERVRRSSKATRGENLQVEHPICGGDAPAFHFYPTVARVLGSTLIRDQVVQVGEPRQKRPLAPSGMMKRAGRCWGLWSNSGTMAWIIHLPLEPGEAPVCQTPLDLVVMP